MLNFSNILKNGVEISSSGTTGQPKTIFRTPENLKACNKVAIDSQELTPSSKVLTVTRMTHAGGLLLQTLPAYTLGCEIHIERFNAFNFLKQLKNFTHTFIAPAHMTALMKTKSFKDCNLKGKRILGGSDPVTWEMIEAFVSKGAIVQPNWGMSEIGPTAINIVFYDLDQIKEVKRQSPLPLDKWSILGNNYYCDWKIENWELLVKGDICIYDGWFNTGDIVATDLSDNLYYKGRK